MSHRRKTTVDRAVQLLEEKIDRLIPEIAKNVPDWYQASQFQYNWRCALGFAPGAVLMAVVTGKTMVAVFLLCVLVILLVSSLGLGFLAMLLTIASAFFCQVTSVYLMFPLIWHSALNLPLLMIFHVFIAVAVAWGLINNATFRNQDPRLVLLVEQTLFAVLPGLTILMLTWVGAMLLGKESVPAVLTITGVLSVSLFVVPLESSFTKPRTPFNNGLILHRAIAIVYLILVSSLPGLFYLVFHPRSLTQSWQEFISFQLHTIVPTFLLSLLEAQSIFHWTGLVGGSVEIVRWLCTGITMALVAFYVLTLSMSTHLPALLVPILFAMFGLVSSLSTELAHGSLIATITTGIIATLYVVSAFQLPWNVSYQFSLLSMPLAAVQLLLLLLALASLPLLLGWQRDLTLLWPTYHAVFVGCEFILSREDLYPLSLLLATSVAAILLCTRLYVVRRLPLPLGILCLCIHVLKLSQFLPSLPTSSSTLSVLNSVGLLLAGFALMRLVSSDPPLSLAIFLSLCGLFAGGLILAADSLLAEAMATITHSPPSAADMACIVCASMGILIHQFLPLVPSSAFGRDSIAYFPPMLFFLAVLFWLLQPEFNPLEFFKAMGILGLHYANINNYRPGLLLIAWAIVLKWGLIAVTCLCALSMSFRVLVKAEGPGIDVAFALLGCVGGSCVAMELMHSPPVSPLGLLYAVAGTVSALLLSSLLFCRGQRCLTWWRISLFVALLVLCAVSMVTEWLHLPEAATTGWDGDTLYDLLPQVQSLPCSRLYLLVFLAVAVVLKFQSVAKDEPVLPLLGNGCCVLVYLLAITNNPLPVRLDLAVVVSTASCVFLLAQADGVLVPARSGLFLAPSLAVTSLTLFVVGLYQTSGAMAHLYDKTGKETAAVVLGLAVLLAAIPGHAVFIHSMWTNRPVKVRLASLLFLILPNAMLSQFGVGTGHTLLGATAILAFSLLAVSDVLTSRSQIRAY